VDDDTPTRADLERALRAAHLAIADLRDEVHQLAARVIALGGGDEIDDAARGILERMRIAIEHDRSPDRLHLGTIADKYAIPTDGGPPCAELLAICEARCCRLRYPLSPQDLDEGVARWDYGRPYLIRHRDGMCVHNTAARTCTIYDRRPAPCRAFDCRGDARIWIDYDRRIPAPLPALDDDAPVIEREHLVERVRARQLALANEAIALRRDGDD
jgi:hypothetical protein